MATRVGLLNFNSNRSYDKSIIYWAFIPYYDCHECQRSFLNFWLFVNYYRKSVKKFLVLNPSPAE